MEIYKPCPDTLGSLADILELGKADGIFDDVTYDSNADTITLNTGDPMGSCLIYMDGSKIIFAPRFNSVDTGTFGPDGEYKDSSSSSYVYRARFNKSSFSSQMPFSAMRCKSGFVFYMSYPDYSNTSSFNHDSFVIAKAKKNVYEGFPLIGYLNNYGPTGIMMSKTSVRTAVTIDKHEAGDLPLNPYAPSVFNFAIKHNGANDSAYNNAYNGLSTDRLILDPIPIPGLYGSNEFFETCFYRAMDYTPGNGLRKINGKQYAVFGEWILLDE